MTNNFDLSPDNIARAVMLVFGNTPAAASGHFWCFLAVKPSLREEVVKKVKDKTLQLASFVDDGYGEVIVSGDTAMPPRDVVKQVAQMFNMPIRDLFQDVDMDSVIAKEVETLKQALGIS